jgi:hypothetical protein
MKKLFGLMLFVSLLLGVAQSSKAGRICTYCWTSYDLCTQQCNSDPYDGCAEDCLAGRNECLADC